jgi:hypothetical protein
MLDDQGRPAGDYAKMLSGGRAPFGLSQRLQMIGAQRAGRALSGGGGVPGAAFWGLSPAQLGAAAGSGMPGIYTV